MDPLIRLLRSSPWARRGLSLLSVVLLGAAVGLLAYPVYTNMYSSRQQSKLDRQIASPALKQAYQDRAVDVGDALTRIRIPALDVDAVVVEGISASALRAGAGHYPDSPLPCEPGNVAIAGHRTTYGKPFANLDRLKAGDEIVLETPVGECRYEVMPLSSNVAFKVVEPTDFSVVANTPGRQLLTLTTCHPKGSAKERLIIQARLKTS
ncbi:MAG: class E sortase [Acidimicrobiales bacterium]